MTRRLACALLTVALVGCDRMLSDLQPDPDTISTKDVVDLRIVGDSSTILSRPDSFVTLVARIPAAASARTVSFTTSAGFFLLTGTKEATVRVEADTLDSAKRLAAHVDIRRDTSAFAIVSANFAGYRDTVRVRFR